MKKITIDEIITGNDGNIYLVGKQGCLRIKRVNDQYSAADFCGYYPEDKDNHKVAIQEIPNHKNRIVGGIAF